MVEVEAEEVVVAEEATGVEEAEVAAEVVEAVVDGAVAVGATEEEAVQTEDG